jgi:hypothetical protein
MVVLYSDSNLVCQDLSIVFVSARYIIVPPTSCAHCTPGGGGGGGGGTPTISKAAEILGCCVDVVLARSAKPQTAEMDGPARDFLQALRILHRFDR